MIIVFQGRFLQNMIFVLYNFVTDDFEPGLSERVVLDKKRTTAENVREVLVNICSRQNGLADSKKVVFSPERWKRFSFSTTQQF